MDQSEIDALLKNAGGKPGAPKSPQAAPPPPPPAAHPAPPHAIDPSETRSGQVISEIDAVTSVTERETNKVMDQLDLISQRVGLQQSLITEIMKHPGAQDPAVQEAIHQIMSAGKDIQDKVFETMDLMQFQDITRQKLERIVHHLRQIHDYIVDLLGTGIVAPTRKISMNPNIVKTGTTPDERKADADAVIEAFRREQKKG